MKVLSTLLLVVAITGCESGGDVPTHVSSHINITGKTAQKRADQNKQNPNNKSNDTDDVLNKDESMYTDTHTQTCIERSSLVESKEEKVSVDLKISKNTIEAVEKDLTKHLIKKDKLSVQNLWNLLSDTTVVAVYHDLIKAYSKLSSEELALKKQVLAYGFLYYLETGKEDGIYKFILADQAHEAETQTISFNATKGDTKLRSVTICDDLKVEEIAIKSKESMPYNVQCSGDKRSVLMRTTGDQMFQINVQSSSGTPYSALIDLNDVEFIDRSRRNVIKADIDTFSQATFTVRLNKAGDFLHFLKFKKGRGQKIKLKNLKCATFKPFDYD